MKVYNNTKLTIETIDSLPTIKCGKNNWRGRDIVLREHGDRIISDGITFDGSVRIICDDAPEDWSRELSCKGNFETD